MYNVPVYHYLITYSLLVFVPELDGEMGVVVGGGGGILDVNRSIKSQSIKTGRLFTKLNSGDCAISVYTLPLYLFLSLAVSLCLSKARS